jgi:cytochrome o ubiquinol oxidase subunit 2
MKRSEKLRIQRRNRRVSIGISVLVLLAIAGVTLAQSSIPVLQPAGTIGAGQKQLLITAFLLMLIVVVPVFILLFTIAWRYRETNKKPHTYRPNWDHNSALETVWWLIPGGLIVILALLTWRGTHQYDPYKPLAIKQDTMIVQVVALDWRWLFIYPDQQVASINELRMPVNKAVQFDITADAPMNSFWIPQLGGQVYAMPGMGARLHLDATKPGEYYGSSANISGEGFSGMNFKAIATSQQDFDNWVKRADSQPALTEQVYGRLAKPSTDKTVKTFSDPARGLYGTIMSKYMNGDHSSEGEQ